MKNEKRQINKSIEGETRNRVYVSHFVVYIEKRIQFSFSITVLDESANR